MTTTAQLKRSPQPVAPPWPGSRADVSLLSDVALLGLMLRRSDAEPDQAASSLLERFGSLGGVAGADEGEVARAAGSGERALGDLHVLCELAVRLAREEASRRPVITSWTALEAYVRAALAHRPREQFRALYFDRRNILMRDELVSEGTVDHAPVYPREVVRRALEISASAMVLVHNHPSGDPTPSRADIDMTHKVIDAARALGIQVHDHIVVGSEGTASFRALGLM